LKKEVGGGGLFGVKGKCGEKKGGKKIKLLNEERGYSFGRERRGDKATMIF